MFIDHKWEEGIIGLLNTIIFSFVVLKLWVLLLNPDWLAQTSSVQSLKKKKIYSTTEGLILKFTNTMVWGCTSI